LSKEGASCKKHAKKLFLKLEYQQLTKSDGKQSQCRPMQMQPSNSTISEQMRTYFMQKGQAIDDQFWFKQAPQQKHVHQIESGRCFAQREAARLRDTNAVITASHPQRLALSKRFMIFPTPRH
jgi:hypothetical protein